MFATFKQWFLKERRILVTASSVASFVILLRWFGLLQPWEWAAYDLFFRLRPLEPVDPRITIIEVTEEDLQKFGHPIPDGTMATLLQKIQTLQPLAIGLDIYRDLPAEPGHEALLKTFETIPNLIGIEQLEDADSIGVRPSRVLWEKNQVGFNNVINDADGKVRRGLLYSWPKDGKIRFSFALKLALIYLKQQNITPQQATSNPEYLQLGKGIFQPFEPNDGAYVRADKGGYQFLANLRGPAGFFHMVSMSQVLSNQVSLDLIKNRIVLVGSTATSLKDFQEIAYSGRLFKAPQKISGVELQANFISQILSSALEGRNAIHVVPDVLELLWILLWSWIGASLAWKLQSPRNSVLSILWIIIGLTGGAYLIFLGVGLWVPVVPPLITFAGSTIAILVHLAYLQQELKRSKEFLQTVINTIPDPIFVKDKDHRRIVLNQAYCKFIGYPLEMLLAKTDYDLFPQHEADIFWEQDERVFQTHQEYENEEGFTDSMGITHLIATKRTLHQDAAGNLFLVGVIRDITERKLMEKKLKQIAAELERSNAELRLSEDLLRYQAYHDALTGLPNRKLFQESLNQALEWAANTHKFVALLFLDLDGFKLINDTLGHNMGDLLLKAVADRLKGCLRGSDTVSRLGGDEFTIILPGIPGKPDATRVAEKILDTLTPAFTLDGQIVSVTTSIGISIYPSDGQDLDTLIKNADTAMYRAKELGKNQYEFS